MSAKNGQLWKPGLSTSRNSVIAGRTISRQEWLRLMDKTYPKGSHPFHDLYNLKHTHVIGKTIGLKTESELSELRDSLVILAESALVFPKTFDVNRSRSQHRKALESKILGPARRLQRELKRTEALTYENEYF